MLYPMSSDKNQEIHGFLRYSTYLSINLNANKKAYPFKIILSISRTPSTQTAVQATT